MLDIQNLSGGHGKITIAHRINLIAESGKWLGLIGANGSGKSTLLRLVVIEGV